MAATAANPSLSSSITLPHTKLKIPLAKFTLPFTSNPHRPTTTTSLRRRRPLHIINVLSNSKARKGSDVLVEALEREGVKDVFAYPRGEWMEICEALTRSPFIINVRPRNELSGIYAAEGYARASGLPGVCIATKLVWGLSGVPNAMLDCVPIVAITGGGQVPRSWMTDDAINDITPFVEEASRSITKHTYLVLNVEDIPRIVKEAFFLACSGQPGPVLISVPEDIQQQLVVPNWDQPMRLPAGSMVRLPRDSSPQENDWEQIVRLVSESRKPVLYVGGGCLNSSEELRRFVELTGIPVASTLMGLRAYPVSDDDMFLGILGMSGSVYANYAVGSSDLLLVFGVRFDEHLTGKLEAFASKAKIVHIDDSAEEIGKNNKQSHVSDVKFALKGLNKVLEGKRGKHQLKLDFSAWRKELKEHKMQHPLTFYAIQVLDELTNGNAIICSGVGQHHMWAAQLFKYDRPGKCPTSGDLRTTGFGLAVAMGAVVARPDSVVVAIDVDGSFMTSNSIHELVTIRVENLPVKIMVLINNQQHLGEDCFYIANNPSSDEEDVLKLAEDREIPAARVVKKEDLRAAIQKMLDTPGPYVLDVVVPHQEEHVLPAYDP